MNKYYTTFNTVFSAQQNPQCVHGAISVQGSSIPFITLWVFLCISDDVTER